MENTANVEAIIRQRPMTDWQTGFWSAFLLALVTCGIYGIYILYKLLDRRQSHFERLISFRYYLIQLLKEKAEADGKMAEVEQDISQLEAMHVEASNRDRAGEKSPVLWTVLSIAVGVVVYYVYYFLNDDFRAHEANEQAFMNKASAVMQKLGMTEQPVVTSLMVPERNFIVFLILTIVTCGIYGIYWWYTLITDPNNHFDNHAAWESQVYAIITAQGGAATAPAGQ